MNQKLPVLWIIALGLLASAIVWERVYATHMGQAVSNTREELELKTARNKHFELELEGLKSPASLERMASERLAMAYPDPDKVIPLTKTSSAPQRRSGWLARIFDKQGT
ncbi:MAG TPA: cell division protein FtsL [Elusimicrobiales bacterium]|nr:cell division protein FtsL [Elusimicrobiales bacterium]